MIIKEIPFEFVVGLREILESHNMVIEPSKYKNGVEQPTALHKHFAAYINDKIVGIGGMVRYTHVESKTIQIYHRNAYTFPEYRNTGIRAKLMEHKVHYCHEYDWNIDDNTIHHAIILKGDNFYKKNNWREHKSWDEETSNGNTITRSTYYLPWKDVKSIYVIK